MTKLPLYIVSSILSSSAVANGNNLISVPINPPIALSFHCSPQSIIHHNGVPALTTSYIQPQRVPSCDTVPNDTELQLLSQAVQEFVTHEIIDMDDSIVATDFTALPSTANNISEERGIGNVRKRRRYQGDNDVVLLQLSGNVDFDTSHQSYDDLLVQTGYLSHVILLAFTKHESALIAKIHDKAAGGGDDESGWLNRVVGYETRVGDGSQERISAASVQRRSLQEDENEGSQETPTPTMNALTIGIQGKRDLTDSSNSTTLLIVGASGAVISVLLLIGGLCYAKKNYNESENKKKNTSESSEVVFQPGKNNPRSPSGSGTNMSSFFKRKGDSSALEEKPPPTGLPLNEDPSNINDDDDDDDDESNADFLLARAALNHCSDKDNERKHNNGDGMSTTGDSQADTHTYGDDMSYAFTVDGESLAPMKRSHSNASSGDNNEDAMIGAGGMSSFANDKGVFRWNEEGTKMVYTPNLQTSEQNEQNGFVFDESKKKWVVKEQTIGEKNVSFKPSTNAEAKTGGDEVGVSSMMSILRTRSADSAGTGMTGLSEFTYDDVALDAKGRTRSGTSISLFGGGGESDSAFVLGGGGVSPGTPQEEGVEVTAEIDDQSEFISNTNVDRFMSDDQTAFSGFTDFSNNAAYNTAGGGSLLPRPVTPERVSSAVSGNSGISDEATMMSFATGHRIVPKKQAPKPNKMKISEELPFDEDIPFDERTRTRSGLKSWKKKSKKKDKVIVTTNNLLDDLDDQSEASEGSANSAQVLQDLDKLSRFMMERKHSSKNNSGSGSSSRRSRAGGESSGSRRLGRNSSYGSRGI